MGYWDRNPDADTAEGGALVYGYVEGNKPTLLAAGLKKETLTSTTVEVRVIMWPLVVDTEFESEVARPAKYPAKIGGPVSLNAAGDWKVNWTVKRGTVGASGFDDLLIAQANADTGGETGPLVYPGSGLNAFIKNPAPTPTVEAKVLDTLDLTDNTISMKLFDIVSSTGATGDVAFTLDYIPFGLLLLSDWPDVSTLFNRTKPPTWVIRNGLNDAPQSVDTDFDNPLGNGKNGNGAVPFEVVPSTFTPLQAVYYVSQSGSDKTGTGEATSPFKTIKKALALLSKDYVDNKGKWPLGNDKDGNQVENPITITDTGVPATKVYPPITLSNYRNKADEAVLVLVLDGTSLLTVGKGVIKVRLVVLDLVV
jgi:hypothetical protein